MATKTKSAKGRTTKATREQWLNRLIVACQRQFQKADAPLPEAIRASCGFTARGGRSAVIGQCFYPEASADGHVEIFIRPDIHDDTAVAAIVVHELAHAALGQGVGHSRPFKALAMDVLGLEGKPTATVTGPRFEEWMAPILARLGKYPHAQLDWAKQLKTQPHNPHKNLGCADWECGYHMKVKVSDLKRAKPTCPCCGEEMMTKEERALIEYETEE